MKADIPVELLAAQFDVAIANALYQWAIRDQEAQRLALNAPRIRRQQRSQRRREKLATGRA